MNLEQLTEKINEEKAYLDNVLVVAKHVTQTLPSPYNIKIRSNEYGDYIMRLYKANTYFLEIEIWDNSLTVWQGDKPHHIVHDSLLDKLQGLGIITP